MPKLSAYLIVKNEARDLPACLDSLKGLADELVVVDDESTDQTIDIARQYGAMTLRRKLDGFGSQKQFALEHCSGDWVLSIDADERVSPELAAEIRSVLEAQGRDVGATGPEPRANGYFISRRMFFLGKRLRFGGVGKDWVMRLFRRTQGRYQPLEVHEQVEVQGATGRFQGSLDHFSYATLNEYLEKVPFYTALAAQQRWKTGKRFSVWHHVRPAWELFSRILLKGAWLDGQAGLIYAALSAHAAWLRSVELWDYEQHSHRSN
jgi:glycosyltransferase involved in cell wall biosynthesis